MVTMISTDQKISEVTPKMLSRDTLTGCGSVGLKTVWTVYSGLVPMSPKTTPRAPIASAACAVACRLAISCPPLGDVCHLSRVRVARPVRYKNHGAERSGLQQPVHDRRIRRTRR